MTFKSGTWSRLLSGNAACLVLVILFVLVAIASSPTISETMDETQHWHYGLFVLQGHPERIDDTTMPATSLNVLPYYVAQFLPDGLLKLVLERTFIARLVTILFSAGIAVLVFRWSRSLYGRTAALFSTFLYVFDPNILAHSTVITTDIYAVGMVTLTFFQLWKFAKSRKAGDGLLLAVILGLSQLAKYSCLALFPLSILVLVIHDWPSIRAGWAEGHLRSVARYIGRLAVYLAIALSISIVIINAGFAFYRSFVPLKDYRFRSSAFRSLQTSLPILGSVPVPAPYPYLQGLDLSIETNQIGDRYGNVYLLGHLSKPKGFPGYYFVAAALKVPIATQVFITAALSLYFIIPGRRARFLQEGVFIVVPVVLLAIYFNFFNDRQIGIRHYLIIFPLLYVLVGSLFAEWRKMRLSLRAGSLALCAYLAISVLSYFPFFIPYFNELVWDKTQTYKYLADSNLDWEQSTGQLDQYLREHPDAVYDPPDIRSGRLVINANNLVGVLGDPAQYAWLRDNFKPSETVAYYYFVFNITPEDVSKLCSTTSYCK